MAAENVDNAPRPVDAHPRFNEAAAHGRGKPAAAGPGPPSSLACFNEAAAHGRGKLTASMLAKSAEAPGFNEAAAHGRGKRGIAPSTSGYRRQLQ